jgi:integrase
LSEDDDARLQEVFKATEYESFKALRNAAIALVLASGITAAELRTAQLDDLDVDDGRPTIYVPKHGPRLARRVLIDAFAGTTVRAYHSVRQDREMPCPTNWLFVVYPDLFCGSHTQRPERAERSWNKGVGLPDLRRVSSS